MIQQLFQSCRIHFSGVGCQMTPRIPPSCLKSAPVQTLSLYSSCIMSAFSVLGQRQGLVCVCDVLVLLYSVTRTPQQESSGQQPLDPNRSPSMDPACADANLCSQTKSVAITEACSCIVVDAGCVHLPQEGLCCVFVLCTTATHRKCDSGFNDIDACLQACMRSSARHRSSALL